jgi:hypothetical protein
MFMRRLISCFLLLASSANAFAAYASDSGKIVEIYTTTDGAMAFRLDGGFPNANTQASCGGSPDIWAGVVASSDRNIKAAILMAKALGSDVVVTSLGCAEPNTSWIRVIVFQIR